MSRLPRIAGEWIERERLLSFEFEGRRYSGFEGDTVSSALAANGVVLLGRSFKYHRPRGLFSAANHDANVLMQLVADGRSIPNVRADVTPVGDGWRLKAVNTRGGVARDRLAVLDRLSRFLPVGFYYKDFFDKRSFPRWERIVRRAAGLGEIDSRAASAPSAKRYAFADVLIIGGGPSGLAAALEAAGRGAQVLLVDENPHLGGSGHYALGGESASDIEALVAAVRGNRRIRIRTKTFAAGYYADKWVALHAPDYLVKVRARAVIVAQGAYEQAAVFRGNDLPGVMLASGAQRLLYRYAVPMGSRIGVLTANPAGYAAALDALVHGIRVAAVFDLREAPGRQSAALGRKLALANVPIVTGVQPYEAHAGATPRVASFEYRQGRLQQRCELDALWMSVGFAPANALLHQAGGRMRYERSVEQFVPDTLPEGVYACGKVNGVYDLADRLADGRFAGACAAAALGFGAQPEALRHAVAECPTHPHPIFTHPRGKEFVDFDEDVQVRDLEVAFHAGFDSSELLKRYSTVGMGPSQGKHSGLNAMRILARLRGQSPEEVGQPTTRPMFHPVPMRHLAGRGFAPERRTPLDAEHARLHAVWMPAGNWRRPEYYARAELSRDAAIAAEVRAVRSGVGLIDVGTLGKIEVHGPDAAEFLERIYTGRYASLKVGMTRYGLMLDEAGVVIDDGVIARLDTETFYFTTTTGNSATLFREFGRLAALWGLRVGLVNLTGHYGAFNLAGPAARAVLRSLTSIDLGHDDFRYLAVRTASVAGAMSRLLRVGFVGEIGYEIHVPAEHCVGVWQAIMRAGEQFGLRPFGVQAQRMLRLEKGHLIVGQDTDGLTTPLDIGARALLKMDKPFFVGQRSLRILERQTPRQTLVGFVLDRTETRCPQECHLVIESGQMAGRVTSIGRSPTLDRCIGLAFVTPALAERGRFSIRIEAGALLEANVAALPFYDAENVRQKMEEAA